MVKASTHLRTDVSGHGQKLLCYECQEGVRARDLVHGCPGKQRLCSCLARKKIGCCQPDGEVGPISERTDCWHGGL